MSQARTCKSCGGWIFDTPILGITNIKLCRCPGPDENGNWWPRPSKPQTTKCAGCGWPIDVGKETTGPGEKWYHPACNPVREALTRRPVTEDDVRRIVREELKRMIDK